MNLKVITAVLFYSLQVQEPSTATIHGVSYPSGYFFGGEGPAVLYSVYNQELSPQLYNYIMSRLI